MAVATRPPEATASPTIAILLPATLVPLPTLTATLVNPPPTPAPPPTAIPTPLNPIRRTPATLMLHRSNQAFDAVAFLREFVELLKQNNARVVTYRDISQNPDITALEQGRLFIITIDDIHLQYGIDPTVNEMIEILLAAGYPAVLSVVTAGETVEKQGLARLKELAAQGWEIATHTDVHQNLGELEKIAPKAVFVELRTSLDKLENALGFRPITLVLPEGQMVDDPAQIKRAGIVWIVGINGGGTYNAEKPIHYIGREGPDGSAAETFRIMQKRFNP